MSKSRMFTSAGERLITAAQTGDRKPTLVQYVDRGNSAEPVGGIKLIPKISAGIYSIVSNMNGIAFEKQSMNTDSLLRFEDPIHTEILGEMDEFWKQRDNYEKKGFLHNRAILMFGPPGSGKSCLIKLAMEDLTNKGDVVFTSSYIPTLKSGLQLFREIEPNRRCLAILEDVDELGEHSLLQLLDGTDTANNILYLATTNYVDRLSQRVLRPGRFDRKIEVPFPPAAGRRAYLKSKLEEENLPKEEMDKLVKATKGFSFGHMREFVAGVFIMKQPLESVLNRLRGDGLEMSADYNKTEPVNRYDVKEAGPAKFITEEELRSRGRSVATKSASVKETISKMIKYKGAFYIKGSPVDPIDEKAKKLKKKFGAFYNWSKRGGHPNMALKKLMIC